MHCVFSGTQVLAAIAGHVLDGATSIRRYTLNPRLASHPNPAAQCPRYFLTGP